MSREDILSEALKISPSEVKWCFVSDFYDVPIEGLLYYKGHIMQFCCFREDIPEQSIYVIHKLGAKELEREIQDKEKFERMVGTHWSFNEAGKPLPKFSGTENSAKQYYDEQIKNKNVEPGDFEVIAWFDIREKIDEKA